MAIVSVIIGLAGCKSTKSDEGSGVKELQVVNKADGTFDVIFPTGQSEGPAAKGNASLITTALSISKDNAEVSPTTGFCWQRCKTGTLPDSPSPSSLDLSCELLGHAKNKEFIEAGAKTSTTAQNLIHNIISKDVSRLSSEETGISQAFAELTANLKKTSETEDFCRPKIGGKGLQLTNYYQTFLYIDNTSSQTLTLTLSALVLASNGYFQQNNGAVFTISPNVKNILSIGGGNVFGSYVADFHVGQTYIGRASASFTSPQPNGEHTITITPNDVAKAGSGGGGGGGGSSDTATCTAVMGSFF